MPFVTENGEQSERKTLELSRAVNESLKASLYNTGMVSISAGNTSATIEDRRCGIGRIAILVPMNTVAAGVQWYLSAMNKGQMTFTFTSELSADCVFGYAIFGTKQK